MGEVFDVSGMNQVKIRTEVKSLSWWAEDWAEGLLLGLTFHVENNIGY